MLSQLTIKDFAIVDRIELSLENGLTALTGETGAGKSILVDALALVLGGRAGPDVVRPGARRAEVTAVFELAEGAEIESRIAELSLDTEDREFIVRRIIPASGRSRAFVNGHPVPVQTLRKLVRGLVEIHGQHAHQQLLTGEHQRRVLDAVGGHEEALARVAEAHRAHRALLEERSALVEADADRDSRLAYIEYQHAELDKLSLEVGEVESLEAEHRRLNHAQEILLRLGRVRTRLSSEDSEGLTAALAETLAEVRALGELDPALEETVALLDQALIHLEEASSGLRVYFDGVDVDPDRLAAIETRLGAIHDLARKHRVPVRELGDRAAALADQAATLRDAQARLGVLDQRLGECEADYLAAAGRLSEQRARTAASLGRAVTGLLGSLGMPHATFEARVLPAAPGASDPVSGEDRGPARPANLTPHGLDVVEFMVATNAGHPAAPLAKVASGGELSRVSLAIHVAGAARAGSPTLIFDEVDVGIGGGVAEQVGRSLRELGRSRQVLCVTHLPQVAAQATSHVTVQKESGRGPAKTVVTNLDDGARVDEIARMLGGVDITPQTVAHAREMLAGSAR